MRRARVLLLTALTGAACLAALVFDSRAPSKPRTPHAAGPGGPAQDVAGPPVAPPETPARGPSPPEPAEVGPFDWLGPGFCVFYFDPGESPFASDPLTPPPR